MTMAIMMLESVKARLSFVFAIVQINIIFSNIPNQASEVTSQSSPLLKDGSILTSEEAMYVCNVSKS